MKSITNWEQRNAKWQREQRRLAREQKVPWPEDWVVRRETLQRQRGVVYDSTIVDFDHFISSYKEVRNRFPDILQFGFCGWVAEFFLTVRSKQDVCEFIESEDLDAIPEKIDEHASELINQIGTKLTEIGAIGVHLFNGKGLDHYLVIVNTTLGVYRLESYSGAYLPRIVSWETWDSDLYKLFIITPGEKRVIYWNGLFSSSMPAGSDNGLYFTVKLAI